MSAVVHELTAAEARAVRVVLHAVEHIDVTVEVVDHVAHVHPVGPVSTAAEVTALRAFAAVTDAVVWGSPVRPPYTPPDHDCGPSCPSPCPLNDDDPRGWQG